MLRTLYSQVVLLRKPCQLQPRLINAVTQRFKISTQELSTKIDKIEIPQNIKFIMEEAQHYGIPAKDIQRVLDTNPNLLKVPTKHWSFVLRMLLNYGFTVEDVLYMLSECSTILEVKEEKLLNNLEEWQSCSFGNDLLLPFLRNNPKFLTENKVDIKKRVNNLTHYFEGRQKVIQAMALVPSIFYENWNTLFEKLQYLHRLHVEPSVVSRTGVLRFDLEFIKMRHEFLIRAGLYKLPTKNYNKQLDTNPKLYRICNTPDHVFAKNVAGLSLLEYEVFQEMYSSEYKDTVDSGYDSDSDVE